MIFFFSNQFNNNSNKKEIFQPMSSTRPMWVGLGWTYVMGWVGLGWIFFYPPWWVGSKNPLNPTHVHPYSWYVYDLPVLLLTIKFWSPIMIDSISDFRWEALTSKLADVPLHQTPIYQTWKLVHGWQVHDAKIFLSNWSYNTVLQLLLPYAHFKGVI